MQEVSGIIGGQMISQNFASSRAKPAAGANSFLAVARAISAASQMQVTEKSNLKQMGWLKRKEEQLFFKSGEEEDILSILEELQQRLAVFAPNDGDSD